MGMEFCFLFLGQADYLLTIRAWEYCVIARALICELFIWHLGVQETIKMIP